jgi:hypothetical protein
MPPRHTNKQDVSMPLENVYLPPVTKQAMPFPFAPLAGLIGGAFNFITENSNQQLQAQIARENTEKTIAYQRQAADLAYSRNLEQWNRANAYDSPKEQMARLKAAGLNPMLVYGSGNAAGGSNPSPQMSVPQGSYNYQAALRPQLDPISLINSLQGIEMNRAQIRKTKAEAETAKSNAIVALVTAMGAENRIPNLSKETQANLDTLLGNALSALTSGKLASNAYEYDLQGREAQSNSLKTAAQRASKELAEQFPLDTESKRINKELLDLQKKSGTINYNMLEEFGVDQNAPAWLKTILRQDPGAIKKLLTWLKSLAE